jgi:phage anti-repressor protein
MNPDYQTPNSITNPYQIMYTTTTYNSALKLIHSRNFSTELDCVSIKLGILSHYLHSQQIADSYWKEAIDLAIVAEEHGWPDDTHIIRDDYGDLALMLPYAKGSLIYGASQGSFGCTLGLILITETCYAPTRSCPGRLNPAMHRFQELARREARLPAALLHEFLEIEESLGSWLAHHIHAHGMVLNEDYFCVPLESRLPESLYMDDVVRTVLLSPMMAKKMACTTPTVRGRKIKACLIHPGVISNDYTEQDPALLEVLFSPPARGLASL